MGSLCYSAVTTGNSHTALHLLSQEPSCIHSCLFSQARCNWMYDVLLACSNHSGCLGYAPAASMCIDGV